MIKEKYRPTGLRGIRLIVTEGVEHESVTLGACYEIQVTESNINPRTRQSETVVLKSVKIADPQQVVAYMGKLGVPSEEVDVASQELVKMDHNVAHFGIHKRFMFTEFKGYLS